jgi:hypothetical protein
MLRKLMGLMSVGVLLLAGVVMAEEINGRIKKVDVDKKTITVEADGKETTYDVADTADLGKGRGGKERTLKSLSDQIEKTDGKGVKATVHTEKRKGKETVTKVEVKGGGKGKGKGGDKDK